ILRLRTPRPAGHRCSLYSSNCMLGGHADGNRKRAMVQELGCAWIVANSNIIPVSSSVRIGGQRGATSSIVIQSRTGSRPEYDLPMLLGTRGLIVLFAILWTGSAGFLCHAQQSEPLLPVRYHFGDDLR